MAEAEGRLTHCEYFQSFYIYLPALSAILPLQPPQMLQALLSFTIPTAPLAYLTDSISKCGASERIERSNDMSTIILVMLL